MQAEIVPWFSQRPRCTTCYGLLTRPGPTKLCSFGKTDAAAIAPATANSLQIQKSDGVSDAVTVSSPSRVPHHVHFAADRLMSINL